MSVKKDGTPYRVLYLPVWMGDDYQVVAANLAKYQLEQAGAKFTLVSAEFDAQKEAHAIEDAIATKVQAIVQPMDPGALASTIDKAIAAGIDVYDWVIPAKTKQADRLRWLYHDAMDGNGQIGQIFNEKARPPTTPEKPYRVLEIWGSRAAPICQDRHNGIMKKGIGDNKAVQIVESVDTAGQPEAEVKAIKDWSTRYPDIQAIYVRGRRRNYRGTPFGRATCAGAIRAPS